MLSGVDRVWLGVQYWSYDFNTSFVFSDQYILLLVKDSTYPFSYPLFISISQYLIEKVNLVTSCK